MTPTVNPLRNFTWLVYLTSLCRWSSGKEKQKANQSSLFPGGGQKIISMNALQSWMQMVKLRLIPNVLNSSNDGS